MYVALADGTTLDSNVMLKAVQRFDLAPMPSTLDLSVRVDSSIAASLGYDSIILAGVNSDRYRVVKVDEVDDTVSQNANQPRVRRLIAFLDGFTSLAWPLNRAVVKERKTLGEIYRSCGVTVRIGTDIPTNLFVCFAGMFATEGIAQQFHEECVSPIWDGSKINFKRTDDLFTGKPVDSLEFDTTHIVESPFQERHEVPWAMSNDSAGIVLGRRDLARPFIFLPSIPQRILNNYSRYLAVRRVLPSGYAGNIRAGDGIDIAGKRYVVVTAAHSWETGSGGQGANQLSRLWLGQFNK